MATTTRPSVPPSHASESEHRRQIANVVNIINQTTPDYSRTAAEISAGVTPVDYRYPEGDARRYGFTASNGVYTVLIPTDFSTLQDALDILTRRPPLGEVIHLKIESGHEITSGTEVTATDMSHVIITAEDAIVRCDLSGASQAHLFGAVHGGKHPQINAVFDMQGTGRIGAYARRSGEIYFRAGAGVINAGLWGAYAYRSGKINASRKHTDPADAACRFDGAGEFAARARRGGVFNGVAANLSGAGTCAVQLNYGGVAYINAADVSNAGSEHIRCLGGSLCLASPLTISDGPLRTNIIPNVANREGLIISTDSVSRGNWTPVLEGAITAGSNTYAAQQGRWVIQNGVLDLWGRIKISNLDSTGALRVTGLPFPVGSSGHSQFPCAVTLSGGGALAAGEKLALRVTGGVFGLRKESNTGSDVLLDTDVTNDFDFAFYARYEVDIPSGTGEWNP